METCKIKIALVLTATAYILSINNGAAQIKKPNMLILIGDDISYNDLGCTGNRVIKTPNIDKLAKTGLLFENVYLTTSSCSPSRVSIITGRYPHNTGAAELHSPVPAGQVAFPKTLKDNGYYTAQAGKWHLGTSATNPEGVFLQAFDRVGGSHSDRGGSGGENCWVEYLQQRPKNKPFFMWFAAHDAHRDWDNEEKPVKYLPADMVVPDNLVDTKATRADLVAYYEEVSRFDHYVGKVIDELKSEGAFDNTLIIVMADNGRPFPRNKTRLYDEGIKTPFIVHWPAEIKNAGAKSSSLLSVIDIAPTILNVAGLPAAASFQGKSFKKLFNKPNAKFRNYVFAEHNWHSFTAYERMIRTDKYLYIENGLSGVSNVGATDILGGGAATELIKLYRDGKASALQASIFIIPQPVFEIYNYKEDPDQLNNLYGRQDIKQQQKRLATTLETWKKETGDNQPTNLTPDWYDRWTNRSLQDKGKRGTMPGASLNATSINKPGPF